MTFAPPKSVSILWALGDQGVREQVEAAHHEAIDHIVKTMESDTIRTRTGAGGVVQETTRGMVAATFDHWDSRAGDPHLHTHLVVANRVQGPDGRWRTLDSNGSLFPSLVSISEAYDNHLMDQLSSRLGVTFTPRTLSRTGRTQWQVDGISDDLIKEFSTRHAQIEAARQDDASGHWDADAKAWAATRSDKTHRSLKELTSEWNNRAYRVVGPDPLAAVLNRPRTVPGTLAGQSGTRPPAIRAADISDEDLRSIAHRVVATLETSRPSWSDWNVRAEAERALRGIRCETTTDRDALRARLCRAATDLCVRIDNVDRAHTPARWRREDGTSRFAQEHDAIWVTQKLLDAEAYLIDVSENTTMPTIEDARSQLVAWRSPDGYPLGEDQVAAVASVLASGRGVDVLVGPAGAGKTTALRALADTWSSSHGEVIGLAPSAAAAKVLSESLGIETANTAQWLTAAEYGRAPLNSGQLIIVDEASMAATLPLADIVKRAQTAGARVVCVGDPHQLGAVEAGGAFGMLTRRMPAPPTLTSVRRFRETWQAHASLMLRDGDASVLTTYQLQGKVTSGTRDAMTDDVYAAWKADREAGIDAIMIAADNETVAALNTRARADLKKTGIVSGREVLLHDHTRASAGDCIVTRLNARMLATGNHHVHNGATWHVVAAVSDGSLLVTPTEDPTAKAISLPADYVANNVELAYASTAHRSQGRTVENSHTLVDDTMTRQTLYVAMTRGRGDNIAHVVLDDPHPETADIQPSQLDGHDALAVLATVLRRDHADRTARETAALANQRAGTVKTLADEYQTIAQAEARNGWQLTLPGLLPHHVEALSADPHYDALCRLLAARTAAGVDVRSALPVIASAERALDRDRPAADLADRVGRLPAPRRPQRRLIAGLIPTAPPSSDPDIQQALDERAARIETRAAQVLRQAVADHEPWARSLGDIPTDALTRAQWIRQATTVAAYRDRYLITDGIAGDSPSMDPLGVRPLSSDSKQQQADRETASRALKQARRIAESTNGGAPEARHDIADDKPHYTRHAPST